MFVTVCVSFVFLFCNICTILLCNAYLFKCCDPFLLEEAPMDVGTTVRMTVTVLPNVPGTTSSLFGCQDSGFLYSRIWEPKLPLCMHSVPCPCWKETLAAADSAISGCFRSSAEGNTSFIYIASIVRMGAWKCLDGWQMVASWIGCESKAACLLWCSSPLQHRSSGMLSGSWMLLADII